jgi:estrogen-related receptor beta like 1
MKNAIKKLNDELQETEVRIGVVAHTLLQLSLRNKHALQAAAAAAAPGLSDEDSFGGA